MEAIFRLQADAGAELRASCPKSGLTRMVRTVDLCRVFDVAQPTVTKALDRLQKAGLVCVHLREGVHLTPAGEKLAKASHERHELVVAFFIALGVSASQAELDAEGSEHHFSQETLTAMSDYVQRA